jgi:hypothetical protein
MRTVRDHRVISMHELSAKPPTQISRSTSTRREYVLQQAQLTESSGAVNRIALAICCVVTAIASFWMLAIAAFETASFSALEIAFDNAPIMENVPRIEVSAFRPRIIAMGVDGLVMVAVCWLLFEHNAEVATKTESRRGVRAGTTLFLLCGLALMSFVGSCFLHIPSLDRACSLHAKEGVIDTFHPIAFGTAAIMLGMTASKSLRSAHVDKVAPIALIGLAVALFVVAMEEISWGQTFLGWQTPESVASWNYQNETNLHNAFNFVLGRAYLAAGLVGFLAVSASIVIRWKFPDHPLSAILPTAPMFWGALWLPPASQSGVYTDTEPFESILAILAIYYAFEIWRKKPAGPEYSDLRQH